MTAVYAAGALAWRHVPLEAVAFLVIFLPLSRIRLPWLRPPEEAGYIALIVAAIVHGGVPSVNIFLFGAQFFAMRLTSGMPLYKRPKSPSRLSRAGSGLLLVLTVTLVICILVLLVFAALGML